MENFSNSIQNSIIELKKLLDKINENKEDLKNKIKNIFTKIRNNLNKREDELIMELDNKFNDLYFKEEIAKEGEKLPNKIKLSLEKGRIIENNWNDKDIIKSLINDCIIIENNVNAIKNIIQSLEKCKSFKSKINFYPEDLKIENNEIFKTINNFGKISCQRFHFKKCPDNINQN